MDQCTPYWDAGNAQLQGPGNVPHGSVEILAQNQATAASGTIILGIATRPGKVADVRIAAITPLTGNATYTVDVRKNGATILTAPLALSAATAARASVVGTLNTLGKATVASGDFFEAVITDTPGAGTAPANVAIQAQLLQN